MTIRFTHVELREVKIPFRFAFKHSLAVRREAHSLIVALHTECGRTGYGEIIPRDYLTGETVASAWRDVTTHYWPAFRDLRLWADRYPWEALRSMYTHASTWRRTAAFAGLDLAAWDAWAQAARRPGWSLFGQPRPLPAPLTGPLGAGSLRSTRRLTCLMKFLGFVDYKLKVGNKRDLAALRLVRRIIGPRADLRVDANGGWDLAQAIDMVRELGQFNVSSVEQPIPAGNPQELARVQQEGGLPVMADESLCTLEDAHILLETRAADIWNLRLAKIGGFTGLLALLQAAGYPLPPALRARPARPVVSNLLASSYRPRLHLGVLVGETSLISTAARACLGLCPFLHVEYGYPRILLKIDPFQPDPGGYSSTARPLSDTPGLGVTPRPRLLDQVTVRREVLS